MREPRPAIPPRIRARAAIAGSCAGALGAAVLSMAIPWWLAAVLAAAGAITLAVAVSHGRPPAASPDNLPDTDTSGPAVENDAERMLRAVIDAVDAPVFTTDADARVVLCNDAAQRLFHRRAGPVAGATLDELFTRSALVALHDEARAGVARRGQIRMVLDGATRWFEVSAVPIAGQRPPGAGVVLTLRDVTELATTVQLKTDFAANASHELRTPVASIRAAVETLDGPARDDETMRERVLRMIESNVTRLEEMITDLLDLSRLESPDTSPEPRPLRASELAETLTTMFEQKAAARSVSLAFELDPALERMEIDPQLLELILRNLIDNAIKFAREGTAVRVVGEGLPGGHAPSLAGARFRVIDRGIGIPLKHQQRIFERFYQVDEARTRGQDRRGTGLGLAIVKHALRRLDGAIHVESVWQMGTTMTVNIPACVRPPAPPGTPATYPTDAVPIDTTRP